MKRFYNIQAGYMLAENAVAAIYGELDGFEWYVDYNSLEFTDRVKRPQRHSLLHIFLEALEVETLEGDLDIMSPSENFAFLARYARAAAASMPPWFTEDQIDSHVDDVKVLLLKLARTVAWAAFEILFNDREFLHAFQLRLSEVIQMPEIPHPRDCYKQNGTIKRCGHLPVWLKKAVFFRDRGICQHCAKDVSGLLNISNRYHFDHILPLARFGTNDPTNFQLLCEDCNLAKSERDLLPQNCQARFWEMDEA